jgi:hypothetical protein
MLVAAHMLFDQGKMEEVMIDRRQHERRIVSAPSRPPLRRRQSRPGDRSHPRREAVERSLEMLELEFDHVDQDQQQNFRLVTHLGPDRRGERPQIAFRERVFEPADRGVDEVVEPRAVLLREVAKDRFLAGIEGVDRGGGDAGQVGNLASIGPVEPLRREQRQRGHCDSFAMVGRRWMAGPAGPCAIFSHGRTGAVPWPQTASGRSPATSGSYPTYTHHGCYRNGAGRGNCLCLDHEKPHPAARRMQVTVSQRSRQISLAVRSSSALNGITHKHGSWLDLAESELGVLASQCLEMRSVSSPGAVLSQSATVGEADFKLRQPRQTKPDILFESGPAFPRYESYRRLRRCAPSPARAGEGARGQRSWLETIGFRESIP